MSENEHYDRAKKRLHNGTTNEVTRAQTEATLALAYEQRTANLIAFYGKGHIGPLDTAHAELRRQIIERLDLA